MNLHDQIAELEIEYGGELDPNFDASDDECCDACRYETLESVREQLASQMNQSSHASEPLSDSLAGAFMLLVGFAAFMFLANLVAEVAQ